jgi:cyclopropane fatty-acyl-phospholipid synthase-like methyltransferase
MKTENSQFFIRDGYRINPTPRSVQHTLEGSRRYQEEAYRLAAGIARRYKLRRVLDIGCGLGTKLVHYLAPLGMELVGTDCEETIGRCRELHSHGRWEALDITRPDTSLNEHFDLVLSIDVIEHLIDPDQLLSLIHRHATAQTRVVISTPERDRRRGPSDLGPPANDAHVREWNSAEFVAYLQSRQLVLLEHRVVDMIRGMPTCQVAVCRIAED